MSYLQIVVKDDLNNELQSADFQINEFPVAQAIFMTLATSGKWDSAVLLLIGNGSHEIRIADKASVEEAVRQARMAQSGGVIPASGLRL